MLVSRSALSCIALFGAAAFAANDQATFLHSPKSEVRAGNPLVIEGSVVTPSPFERVVVRSRSANGDFEETPIELQYGDLYRGTIAAWRIRPPLLEYFVEGISRSGARVVLFASQGKPARVRVTGSMADVPPPETASPEKPNKPTPSTRPEKPEKPETPQTPDEPSRWSDDPDSNEPLRMNVRPADPSPREPEPKTSDDAPAADVALEESAKAEFAPVVLTAADIRRSGARYVYEVIDLIPGLSVSRDMQGNYRIAMRGIRSDASLLITLNGLVLNNFYDGKALWTVPVDNIERIEVMRAPSYADIGIGSVLGHINIVTKRESGFRASASGGMGLAFDGHLSAAHTFGSVKAFVDADVASQSGLARPVGRDGLDTTVIREKSTSDRRLLINVGAGVSISSTSLGTLQAQGRFLFENRSALLGLFDVVGPDSQLGWVVGQAELSWRKRFGDHAASARVYFSSQSTSKLWQLSPDGYQYRSSDMATFFPDGALEKDDVGTLRIGLSARTELSLPANNRLSLGIQTDYQLLTNYALLFNLDPATNRLVMLEKPAGLVYPTEDGKGGRGAAAGRLNVGAFVYDTFRPFDFFVVHAGVRFDLTQLPVVDSTGLGFVGATLVPSFGPRLSAVIAPTSFFVVRGQYGRAYRAPTVQEYAEHLPNADPNQGRSVGNPAVVGEYVDTVEVSGDYLQGIGGGKLKVTLTGFLERFTNPLVALDTTGNLAPYTNRLSGVQSLGVEAAGRLELTSRLSVFANVSWVRAEDLGTPSSARFITDIPQLRFNAGLTIPLYKYFNFDLALRYASERRNNSRTVLELVRRYTLPAYTIVTAQVRTELLFKHLELAVLAQNVFATDYADDAFRPDRVPNGVPRESVMVFGSARLVFE